MLLKHLKKPKNRIEMCWKYNAISSRIECSSVLKNIKKGYNLYQITEK